MPVSSSSLLPQAGEGRQVKNLKQILPGSFTGRCERKVEGEETALCLVTRTGQKRVEQGHSCGLPTSSLRIQKYQEMQTSLFGLWSSHLLPWQLGGLSGGWKEAAAGGDERWGLQLCPSTGMDAAVITE